MSSGSYDNLFTQLLKRAYFKFPCDKKGEYPTENNKTTYNEKVSDNDDGPIEKKPCPVCPDTCPKPPPHLYPEDICPNIYDPPCCYIKMQDPCAPPCCEPTPKASCSDYIKKEIPPEPSCGCDLCKKRGGHPKCCNIREEMNLDGAKERVIFHEA